MKFRERERERDIERWGWGGTEEGRLIASNSSAINLKKRKIEIL